MKLQKLQEAGKKYHWSFMFEKQEDYNLYDHLKKIAKHYGMPNPSLFDKSALSGWSLFLKDKKGARFIIWDFDGKKFYLSEALDSNTYVSDLLYKTLSESEPLEFKDQ